MTRGYASPSASNDAESRSLATPQTEVVRVPPGYFGTALGPSALAALWLYAADHFGAPSLVGDLIAIVAAVLLIVLMALYVRQGTQRILADFRDTALGPFFATPVVSGLILGSILWPHAEAPARVIVIVFLVMAVLVCGGLLGQWMTGGLTEEQYGPSILLPGASMNGVGAQAAAVIGLHKVAAAFFGIEVVTWVLTSAVVFGRLNFRPQLAASLLPTMAIELAVPANAGSAWFVMGHGADGLSMGIAAYLVIMVVVQARLLPLYLKLNFTPTFWSFTFPAISAVTLALRWIVLEHPAGAFAYAWILVVLVTTLTTAIAVRSVRAIARGEILLNRHAMRVQPDGGCPPELVGGR
jgi:tellurite resistance protein